jgi:hypothetical protein
MYEIILGWGSTPERSRGEGVHGSRKVVKNSAVYDAHVHINIQICIICQLPWFRGSSIVINYNIGGTWRAEDMAGSIVIVRETELCRIFAQLVDEGICVELNLMKSVGNNFLMCSVPAGISKSLGMNTMLVRRGIYYRGCGRII